MIRYNMWNIDNSLFDIDRFRDTSLRNEDIMDDITISCKFPADFTQGGQYRVTHVWDNMSFRISDEDTTISIPCIYVHRNEDDEWDLVGISYYYDNDYSIIKNGGVYSRYLWHQARYEDEESSVGSLPAISVEGCDYYDEEFSTPVGPWSAPFTIKTGLPIFEVTSDFSVTNPLVKTFQTNHDIDAILSYSEVIGLINDPNYEIVKEWYIYNEYIQGTASVLEGFVPNPNSTLLRRYERIKTKGNGNLSLVRQSDGTYNIVADSNVTIIGSYYGNHTIYDLHPYEDTIFVTSGFYYYWDGYTTGNITCATRANTNMYWYASESDRQDVEDGRKKPDDVSIHKPDETDNDPNKPNPNGPKEHKTKLSNPTWTNQCVAQYILTSQQMATLANALFTTDETAIEAIVKGIGTMFTTPIEAIVNVAYYPFSLANYTYTTNHELHIGGWNSHITAPRVESVTKRVTIGSFPISRVHKNYRDFYCESVQIWLPYIGMKQLDIKRFLGKTLKVEYAFDLYTNQCTAFLLADEILVDYFNGTIGVNIPLTATNYSQFASSALQLTLSGAGLLGTTIATGGAGALGIAGLVPQTINTFNLNNYRESKGSLTSYISGFAPQYVYLLFEELEPDDNEEYIREIRGLPSNYIGTLSEFSGYVEIEDINLVCQEATEEEKNEIVSMLQSGIYIR